MPTTPATTIRLTDEEKEEAMKKARAHGLTTLADVIRMALKKLRSPNSLQ